MKIQLSFKYVTNQVSLTIHKGVSFPDIQDPNHVHVVDSSMRADERPRRNEKGELQSLIQMSGLKPYVSKTSNKPLLTKTLNSIETQSD